MRSVYTAPLPTNTIEKALGTEFSQEGLELSGIKLSYENRESLVLDEMSLAIPAGQTLALLGPSGCGKTSLLRCIAGLEIPIAGKIQMGGKVLFNRETRINLKPENRQIGMVFQDLALFPHLSVAGNVAYGLSKKCDRTSFMAEALELVHLSGFENRRISTLSIGQKQRVALARALAPKPKMLLLDEPFSSLDEPTRVELRSQIAALLDELHTTVIFVAHNQDDAFIMGDQVAVMHDKGKMEQQDNPANLYASPKNPWVADFVGHANLIKGISVGDHATTFLGDIPLLEPTPINGLAIDTLIRPEDLIFSAGSTDLSFEIALVEYYGHDTLFLLSCPKSISDSGQLWVRSTNHASGFVRGDMVSLKYVGPKAPYFH